VSGSDNRKSATGKMLGRTIGAEGKPVATALVELLELGLRTYTDQEGLFEIADIPVGTYTIRVIATGFRSQREQVEIDRSLVHAEFRLTPI
jgi:Carboxypeptidase regulatory-like domain